MQEEGGAGPERAGEGRAGEGRRPQKEGSDATPPPSERLKGESTESDLDEDDDEAIELREGDEDDVPYGQVSTKSRR